MTGLSSTGLTMQSAADWIRKLDLQAHPEGGFYRETYRAESCFEGAAQDDFPAGRHHSTAIYFLLEHGNFSAFHRIRSDELWHFYAGDGLLIHVISPDGNYRCLQLGTNTEAGQLPQAVVPADCWFASEVVERGSFALVGCTVSPGFDFADFELGSRKELISLFPQYQPLLRRMIRSQD
ncbi:MAG: cupin domain-containing protein [Mariprofundaceae bacterium]|nr:cupin domain-containing protein [Mariprofundaceae bacterium]